MVAGWTVVNPPSTGVSNPDIRSLSANLVGAMAMQGQAAITKGPAKATFNGRVGPAGPVEGTVQAARASFVGKQEFFGSMGVSLQPLGVDIHQELIGGDLAAETQKLKASISGEVPINNQLGASIQQVIAHVEANQVYTGALGSALQKAVAELVGAQTQSGTAAATAKAATASAAGITTPIIVTPSDVAGVISSASPTTSPFSSYTPVAGDWLVYFWNTTSTSVVYNTMPTDWINPLGGTNIVATASANRGGVLAHKMTAADVAAGTTQWTFANLFSASITGYGLAFIVRGANGTNPIDVTATQISSSTTTTMVIPGVTPTVDSGLVVAMAGPASTTTGVGDPSAPWSTLVKKSGGSTVNLGIIVNANATKANQAVDGTTVARTNNGSYLAMTLVIKP